MDAGVLAEHGPVGVDDLAGREGAGRREPLDESGGVAVGHEADLVRVGLVRGTQRESARQRAGLVLRLGADGEARERSASWPSVEST